MSNKSINLVKKKYNPNSNYLVTFEEMILDFESFEPTNILIIDITIITIISKYIYEFANYNKWKACNDLEKEIIHMIMNVSNKLNNINQNDLKLIFQKYNNNKNSPDTNSLKNELYQFVENIVKSKLNLLQINDDKSIKEYLDFRSDYQNQYKSIINKYKGEFNEIEIKMNNISNILAHKFEKLEDLPEFEDIINTMENFNIKADIKMKKLIDITNDQINKVNYKSIMEKFDDDMNTYFENEIKLLNFNDEINNILFELYDVEKVMYRSYVNLDIIRY